MNMNIIILFPIFLLFDYSPIPIVDSMISAKGRSMNKFVSCNSSLFVLKYSIKILLLFMLLLLFPTLLPSPPPPTATFCISRGYCYYSFSFPLSLYWKYCLILVCCLFENCCWKMKIMKLKKCDLFFILFCLFSVFAVLDYLLVENSAYSCSSHTALTSIINAPSSSFSSIPIPLRLEEEESIIFFLFQTTLFAFIFSNTPIQFLHVQERTNKEKKRIRY